MTKGVVMLEDFKRIEGLVKKAGFPLPDDPRALSSEMKASFLKFREYCIEEYKKEVLKEIYGKCQPNQLEMNFNESRTTGQTEVPDK